MFEDVDVDVKGYAILGGILLLVYVSLRVAGEFILGTC